MATCMECIHFNPCNMHGNIIVEKPTEGNDWGLHNEVEKECKYFTPTADVVEVVRCKDCDVPHNKWTGCPHLNGLIPPPDFYCAKGTPKERGEEK